jgi:hypothetical protein
MGIATTGGFTVDAKKDEIGLILPITFVKRVLIFVLALVVVMNFGVFYFSLPNTIQHCSYCNPL